MRKYILTTRKKIVAYEVERHHEVTMKLIFTLKII